MPDENGLSRRERNERFGQGPSPTVDIPDHGLYLWEWYFQLSGRLRRVRDSVCEPIPPSEFLAWCEASGTIVNTLEYGILSAMDDAFCDEMNQELKDYNTRMQEKREFEAQQRGRQ
jgi:hypothetical protein